MQFVAKHLDDKFYLEKGRVFTENSNIAHGLGVINPDNFSPYPKNPVIAKFFKEVGWVDELGSGIRNINKYNRIYSGEETEALLEFCNVAKRRQEIQEFVDIKSKNYFRRKILNPLIKGGLLSLTVPSKPTSPNQKYYSTRSFEIKSDPVVTQLVNQLKRLEIKLKILG